MDDPLDPALLAEIADVEDEIALKEAILASLNDDGFGQDDLPSEDEELRKTARKDLKRLRKHLRALKPARKNEGDGTPSRSFENVPTVVNGEASGTQNPQDRRSPLPRPDLLEPPTHSSVVSRKRQRESVNDDDERPSSLKSRRTTPSPSFTAAPSPAASSATLDSLDSLHDPFPSSWFGDLSEEEVERNKNFWKSRENDEKLAQSLSHEWADNVDIRPAHHAPPLLSNHTQSYLGSSGSVVKPEPSASARSLNSIKPEPSTSSRSLSSIKPEPSNYTRPTNIFESQPFGSSSRPWELDSDSDLPSWQTTPRLPGTYEAAHDHATSYIKRETEPGFSYFKRESGTGSFSMPGAFPNTFPGQPQYMSAGGSSVYNQRINVDGFGANSPVPRPAGFETPPNDYPEPRQTQEELRQLLEHIRPDEELTANEMPPQPSGLKVSLMPHQLSGLAWMKRMEEGTNKGGILADDMGLGKTLQSIALILERPPPEDKKAPTLVVCPVALLHQWKREIEKMVRTRRTQQVLILHGETRKASWPSLKAYDVVLTTYGLLGTEYKRKVELEAKAKRLGDHRLGAGDDCPILGDRSRFHRVILDEAHNIKNRATKAAHAAYRIQSEYRWCLTGTPMMNNTEELFSLVHFCRIRPYCEWNKFRNDIAGPLKRKGDTSRERGMLCLRALLRAILLRRTKKSNIHGQPILQLPPKETREDRVVFEKDQEDFYFALERQAQIQANRYLQKGTIGKHYANMLVLLLRLRQAACHPALVIAGKDFIQLPSGELNTDALMRNAQILDVKVVERLKQLDAYECPVCFDVTENPTLFFCGHAICGDCLARLTDNTKNNGTHPKCPQCRAEINVDNVTDYASFLRVHCPEHESLQGPEFKEAGRGSGSGSDSDSDSDSDDDTDDSDEGDDLDGFIVYDSDLDSNSNSRKAKKSSKNRKSKSKSKSKSKQRASAADPIKSLAQLRQESLRNKSARRKYLKRLKKNFQPSAKTTRTVELLEQIKSRGENEKTIIFSNFTSFLDIIETALYDHKDFSKYVRYDGSMSSIERNDAVLEFTENRNCLVILVSLKAGNAGLNLTAANHVIMLDPFWNPYVEYQASDRCYRIGQQRDVTVHRVLIGPDEEQAARMRADLAANGEASVGQTYTVEDRILHLQEQKRELVESALDESAGRAVSRLGVRELGYLFGLNSL